jgi:hypothetical protein
VRLVVAQLVKKFAVLYGTQRVIAVLTETCHWGFILSQMNPFHILARFFKVLFSDLCPGLPSGLFPSGFPH